MLGWLFTISELSDSFHSGYCWGNSRRSLLGSEVWGCFGRGAATCETQQSALRPRHVLRWAVVREVVNMLRCSRQYRAWSCEAVVVQAGLPQGKWVSLGVFQKAGPSAWARLCTCRLPDHLWLPSVWMWVGSLQSRWQPQQGWALLDSSLSSGSPCHLWHFSFCK